MTVFEAPSISGMIKNHIVEGAIDSSQFQDEEVLTTLIKDANMRINVYNTYDIIQII